LSGFKKRIIASDGGPGHFKTYQTQFFMSYWASQLREEEGIEWEWNMFFANLGHNVCDGHAGHLKRYFDSSILSIFIVRAVRKHEKDFHHMYSCEDVIVSMENVKRTTKKQLTYEQIQSCDEEKVIPKSRIAFIKKYHHFKYVSCGVVECSYIKNEGDLFRHEMVQSMYFPHLSSWINK
jgi:hypothetical protein